MENNSLILEKSNNLRSDKLDHHNPSDNKHTNIKKLDVEHGFKSIATIHLYPEDMFRLKSGKCCFCECKCGELFKLQTSKHKERVNREKLPKESNTSYQIRAQSAGAATTKSKAGTESSRFKKMQNAKAEKVRKEAHQKQPIIISENSSSFEDLLKSEEKLVESFRCKPNVFQSFLKGKPNNSQQFSENIDDGDESTKFVRNLLDEIKVLYYDKDNLKDSKKRKTVTIANKSNLKKAIKNSSNIHRGNLTAAEQEKTSKDVGKLKKTKESVSNRPHSANEALGKSGLSCAKKEASKCLKENVSYLNKNVKKTVEHKTPLKTKQPAPNKVTQSGKETPLSKTKKIPDDKNQLKKKQEVLNRPRSANDAELPSRTLKKEVSNGLEENVPYLDKVSKIVEPKGMLKSKQPESNKMRLQNETLLNVEDFKSKLQFLDATKTTTVVEKGVLNTTLILTDGHRPANEILWTQFCNNLTKKVAAPFEKVMESESIRSTSNRPYATNEVLRKDIFSSGILDNNKFKTKIPQLNQIVKEKQVLEISEFEPKKVCSAVEILRTVDSNSEFYNNIVTTMNRSKSRDDPATNAMRKTMNSFLDVLNCARGKMDTKEKQAETGKVQSSSNNLEKTYLSTDSNNNFFGEMHQYYINKESPKAPVDQNERILEVQNLSGNKEDFNNQESGESKRPQAADISLERKKSSSTCYRNFVNEMQNIETYYMNNDSSDEPTEI